MAQAVADVLPLFAAPGSPKCTVCTFPLDGVLAAAGERTHPACDPAPA
jgi:hypothetical protein